MLGRVLSMAGLLSLVLAVGFMFGPGPEGGTVFRVDRLLLGLVVAVVCFIAAARVSPRP